MLVRLSTAGRMPGVAPASDGDRSALARLVIAALAVALVGTFVFALAWGASDASTGRVLLSWVGLAGADGIETRDRLIVETIRLPRVILGMLIGAALAVSGAVMQGLFRNPLADPGIVGVSAGAGLGAASVIVLGSGVLAPAIALAGIAVLRRNAAARTPHHAADWPHSLTVSVR